MKLCRVIHKFLCHEHKDNGTPERPHHLFPGSFFQFQADLITHSQHQGDIDKGLSAWKAVWIMEPMPDEI